MQDFEPENDEDEFEPLSQGDDDDFVDEDEEEENEEDEDDIEDFPDSEETEEDVLVRMALIQFSFKFSEYVKEMDIELWKRAVDYAATFTKVEGVEFTRDEPDPPASPPPT